MIEKVVTITKLKKIVQDLKRSGRRIVWTNGCYDLLHAGHVSYLQRARKYGDVLIVGLNSDASVRLTKGPGRPIVPEQERALVMSALSCVDYVVIFADKSPLKIIGILQPDVYVKGGDYTIDTINQEERRLVEEYGGRIAIVPGVAGRSTTTLIKRISKAYGKTS